MTLGEVICPHCNKKQSFSLDSPHKWCWECGKKIWKVDQDVVHAKEVEVELACPECGKRNILELDMNTWECQDCGKSFDNPSKTTIETQTPKELNYFPAKLLAEKALEEQFQENVKQVLRILNEGLEDEFSLVEVTTAATKGLQTCFRSFKLAKVILDDLYKENVSV